VFVQQSHLRASTNNIICNMCSIGHRSLSRINKKKSSPRTQDLFRTPAEEEPRSKERPIKSIPPTYPFLSVPASFILVIVVSIS